jgi:heat shock protein HslJ
MKNFERFYAVAGCCILFFLQPIANASINVARPQIASYKLKADTTAPRLKGTEWQLSEVNGKKVDSINPGMVIFIILEDSSDNVTGFAGCNDITGTYELNGKDGIKFPELNSTKKACPDQDKENNFLHQLGAVDSYEVNGDRLTLSQKGKPILKFRKRRD